MLKKPSRWYNSFMKILFINTLTTFAFFGIILYFFVTQKTLLAPLVLGFFLSLLILPTVRKLESWRVPRILANILMITCSILVILGIGVAISFALSQFISELPTHQSALTQNFLLVQEWIAQVFHFSVYDQQQFIAENFNIIEISANNIGTILSSAGSLFSILGLTFIYTFFLLYYRDKLKIFLEKFLGDKQEKQILTVVRKIGSIIPSYLTGLLWVIIILSILIAFGLWIVGVDNAMFWGISIAMLNIIPYIGTTIGFILLVIFVGATQGLPLAIAAIIIFIITQFIDNNILTPLITGGKIDINPLAAIVGLIVIGSLWGTLGLIIALPIIGIIKIVADSLPEYEAFGYLLGNQGTEKHAITWHSIKKYFGHSKKH